MVSKSNNCDGVEDHVLVARMADGDNDAFECLYRRFTKNLVAFICGRGIQLADAEEIVQDVWAKFYKKFHRQPITGDAVQVRGFLFQIARTTRIDWIRKRITIKETQFGDGEAEHVVRTSAADSEGVQRQENHFFIDCLEGLSKEFREIVLRRMRGEKHDEIAKALDIAIGTSHSGFHRGQEELKDCVQRKLQAREKQES